MDEYVPGLARTTDPATSHEAAETNVQGVLDAVYQVIKSFGATGCISDDVESYMLRFTKMRIDTVSPRYAQLLERGMISRTGETRPGISGRNQLVMVANEPPFLPPPKKHSRLKLALEKIRQQEIIIDGLAEQVRTLGGEPQLRLL